MEVGPPQSAVQAEIANHLKLLGSKALVVSVEEKTANSVSPKVSVEKASGSEPFDEASKCVDEVKTGALPLPRDEFSKEPVLAEWPPALRWRELDNRR